MFQLAVCDDETYFREQEINILKGLKLADSPEISEYQDGVQLAEECARNPEGFQIVLLDIEMPGQDGLETARRMREANPDLIFIFLSGHSSYVFQSFEVQPFRYLVKPIDEQSILKALNDAVRKLEEQHAKLTIRTARTCDVVEVRKIRYVEVINHTIHVDTMERRVSFSGRIEEIADKLIPRGFIRFHRSFLVNPGYIRQVRTSEVILDNERVIPISKRNKQSAMQNFNSYLMRCGI